MNKYEKLRKNIIILGKMVMPQVMWAKPSFVHFRVNELITDTSKRLLNIILPRGLGKTTFVSQLNPLRHIFLEEIGQPKFVVIVSKTQGHAINCLTAIKDILEYNLAFRDLFGYHGAQNARMWRNDMIVLDNGSIIMAKGMGQPIRGLNYNGIRPTLIILDDPEDENNTKTPEAMDNNLLWLLKGALPALDTRFGRCIVIGTPLHQLCIVEKLAESSEWETVRYSYLQDAEGNPSLQGESIWKEMKSTENLLAEYQSLEDMGRPSVFFAERMCQIVGDENQLFKPEYIQYWDGSYVYDKGNQFLSISMLNGEYYNDPLIVPVNIFIGVDPASSVKQTADYSVIFPLAVDSSDNIYTLDYVRKRMTPMHLANAILQEADRYNPKRVRIETVGYQEMLRDYLRTQRYIPGLEIPENPRTSKSKRFEGLEPEFANKKVFIKRGSEDFIGELLMFPRGKHEDTIDGYFYARKNYYKPSHKQIDLNPNHKKKVIEQEMIDSDWLLS